LFGPTVYVNYLADKFHKTPNQTSQLTTYPNLLFGFGNIFSLSVSCKDADFGLPRISHLRANVS